MFQTEVVDKMETHFMCNNLFPDSHAAFEIMWKNTVQSQTDHRCNNTAHALCMPHNYDKNTDTHSEYLMPIAFLR